MASAGATLATTSASFMLSAQISAINKLEVGPAAATKAMSRLGWRRFSTVMGTGLAQPKITPPARISTSGTSTVPMGSMCFKGLRARRPSIIAVGSPSLRATQPWATSWTVMANNTGSIHTASCCTKLSSCICAVYPFCRDGGRSPLAGFRQKQIGIALAHPHHLRRLLRQIAHGGGLETAITAIHDQVHLFADALFHLMRIGHDHIFARQKQCGAQQRLSQRGDDLARDRM